jgi:hypothetical protein
MPWFKRDPARKQGTRLSRQLALGRLDEAMGQAEDAMPPEAAPIAETVTETPRERVLCYSPNGGFAHDDLGGLVSRPACHGGAKRYERAVSPAQKQHAATLKPCPHCARLRESGETRAAS